MRKLLSYLSLFGVVLWLLLSYMPESLIRLPMIALPATWNPALQRLLAIGAILFVVLQLWLVAASVRFFQPSGGVRRQALAFHLTARREFILTALPILLTLLLALASYQTWLSLAPPT